MHEVRRYDGEGNLIETISAEEVKKKFWQDLIDTPEISEEAAKSKQNSGIYHLITPLQRKGPEKKCAFCGEAFVPPRHKPQAKFCFKPGVRELDQCRRLDYREKQLKPKVPVQCAVCGESFLSANRRAKFCPKPDCNHNALGKLERARRGGLPRSCRRCGKGFKAMIGNQQYCGTDCFNLSRKEKKRHNT
jgi:hypothetical protein